jgi:hypothetical protein
VFLNILRKKTNEKKSPEKKKDGTPKSNNAQNKQAKDAKREIERQLGRELTPKEERQFHDYITGQNYSYQELVEEGYWILFK